MDNYATQDRYKIVERLNEKKTELKKKYYIVRNWIITLIVIIASLVSYSVYNSNAGFLVIIPLGVEAGLIAACFLITENAIRGKMIKIYFNEEVMNVYNMENEVDFSYTQKPKLTNEFNKEMGLFTRAASVSASYQIKGIIDEVPFDLRNLRLVVNAGNSTQLVFDGIYIILPIDGEKMFQVRSNYKPALKKTKFKKISDEDKKVYVLEDDEGRVKDKYLRTFDMLNREENYKKVYIGSNEKEIHIGITLRKKIKYPKVITDESFKLYYDSFIKTLQTLHEVMTNISEVY